MPTEMEFVNYKQFVENLPEVDDFASTDKSVVSNPTNGPRKTAQNNFAKKDYVVPVDDSMLSPGVTVLASKDDSSFDWTDGLCASTNGAITSYSGFKYNATLIPAEPNAKYKLGGRQPSERVYFYDENGDFISASAQAGSHVSSFDFETPANCYFIRYSYLTTDSGSSELKWNDGFSSTRLEEQLSNKVVKDKSMFKTEEILVSSSDVDFNWSDGLCDKADGTITTMAGFKYNATLIPVYPSVKYKLGHRDPAERVYFYDKDGNFIQASVNAGSGATSFEFIVPNECYFIRYSYYTGISGSSILQWAAGFSLTRVEEVADKSVAKDTSMIYPQQMVASKYDSSLNWTTGLCQGTAGGITVNSNFNYNATLIPVHPCAKYKLGSRQPAERVYFYDENGDFISASAQAGSHVSSFDFETPANCYFIRYSYLISTYASSFLWWNDGFSSSRVEDIGKNVVIKKDFETISCPTIYDRVVGTGQKNETRVYAEGFVFGEALPIKINDGIFASITRNKASSGNDSLLVTLSGETVNSKSINLSVNRVSVTSGMSGKKFVLFIGESTTEASERDPLYGDYYEDWGTPSAVQKFNIKDIADGIGKEIKTIGTRGNKSLSFTYNGNTYTNRSFHEGRSGWPSYCFANWPCLAKLSASTTRFGAAQMWYALGLATKTPYSSESYNEDVEDYTGTASQRDLITKTKFGEYKVDGSNAFWTLCQSLSGQTGYPIFGDTTSAYTGSASQIQMLQDWCDALALEPINPFYDVTFARDDSKGTAFNIGAYLSRYRTMDDAGVRLSGSAGESVVGSDGVTYTIGSRVVDVANYDVCTPNVVIFNVGINDTESAASADSIFESIKALLGSTAIKCGWYITRYPGALIPALWHNSNVRKHATETLYGQYVNKVHEWLSGQSDKIAIPALFVQPPNSATGGFMANAFDYGEVIDASINEVHAGINAYRAVGWSIINWIYSLT